MNLSRLSNPATMPALSNAITLKTQPCRKTRHRRGPAAMHCLPTSERRWRGCRTLIRSVSSVVEGDRVAIHWNFVLTEKSGLVRRFDELAWQEWRGDKISRERFFYDPTKVTG
jgi:ketosteroid isomerase-like protein